MNRKLTHRSAISWAIVGVIAILVVWSVANIAAMARVYHDSVTVWLLGVGFGGANAISVYVLATASGWRLRWPAIVGAALFGGGSAIIQTNLYLLEGAGLLVAVAFGSLGPVAEAVLAWTAAALDVELAAEETATPAAKVSAGATAKATADRQPPAAKEEPPTVERRTAKTDNGATANLSATASAKIHQIRQLAEGGGWATDAELAGLMDWSETTARRYRSMAEDNSFIHRNGDGRYHLGGGAK